jgi:hypothetical protein
MVGLVASLAVTTAQAAIPPVGEQSGWSGFVIMGAGLIDGKSNLVSGNDLLDFGTDPVGSVNDSPKSGDDTFPFFTGEVAYTFGSERIQLFAGGSIENWATMDLAQQIGLRKQFETLGTIQVGVLLSGIPAEVWEDPYVEGIKRQDTDQKSPGVRFQWDRIAGTPLEFTFSYRDIDIDTERSGEFLGLSDDERGQLRRDGDQYTAKLGYRFQLSSRQWLQPEIGYRENDRDGAAVSNDGLFVRGEWAYRGDIWSFGATAQIGSRDHDAPHPVYDRRLDSDNLAFGLQAFYQLPTASNRWSLNAGIVYAEVDSDVNFHDTELFVINFGALYRFGMLPRGR